MKGTEEIPSLLEELDIAYLRKCLLGGQIQQMISAETVYVSTP